MSGGTELLALTGAAVQPLLFDGGETRDNIDDTSISSLPTYTIFSPLADASSSTTLPLSLPSDTPSPLTIPAHELESGSLPVKDSHFHPSSKDCAQPCADVEGGGGVEEGLSPWTSPLPSSSAASPHKNAVTQTPGMCDTRTPGVCDTQTTGVCDTWTPGAGIKIKISAKKVREVASPLLSPGPVQDQGSRSTSCSASLTPREDTPRALSPLVTSLPPSSLAPLSSSLLPSSFPPAPLEDTHPKMSAFFNKAIQRPTQHKSMGLAQGVFKSSGSVPSPDTSLENSVIVSQTQSTVAPHNVKEKMFQQQAVEKQVRFRVVHPQMIRQPGTDLGDKREDSPISPPPQKRVGGSDTTHSNQSSKPKNQQEPGTDSSAAGQTAFPPSQAPPRRQRKQFSCVPSDQEHASTTKLRDTVSGVTGELHDAISGTSSSSLTPFSFPPSHHPSITGFEETVKLVASCTAAATAAALTAQKGSADEAKRINEKKSLAHFTSKEKAFDSVMNSNQSATALPSTFCPREREKAVEYGGVFPTGHPLVKATEAVGVKLPLVEKETEQCRQFTSWFLSQGVQQHPPKLNNQTPHRKVCTKTQNKNYFNKERQGSPPPSLSARDRDGDDGASEAVSSGSSSPEQAVNHPKTQDLELVSGSSELHALVEIEKMLMEVQQARRDLESHSVLTEVQEGWRDTMPPITSDGYSNLDFPEHRVAVLLNQLKPSVASAPGYNIIATQQMIEEESDKMQPRKLKHSRRSRASQQDGQKGKMMNLEGVGKGNSQTLTTEKGSPPTAEWKGSVTKEKSLPRNCSTRKAKEQTNETMQHKGVGVTIYDKENGDSPPADMPVVLGQWRVPPPSLPVLHSQVLNTQLGMPLAGYALPSGVVVCDPSTGMPLLGSSRAMVSGVMLPPPPCIHMPTAIPLGPPSTTPCQFRPPMTTTITASTTPCQFRPMTTTTVSPAEPVPPEHAPTSAGHVSVTDVCLQTSFSETDVRAIPNLVQEVFPPTNISTNTESLDETSSSHKEPPSAPPFAAIDIEEENTHNSSADSVGISLVGKYAGSSPTNGPVHPTGQLCNNNTELCAEEVDQRIGEHLESKILQWVTQELLTRAQKSRDTCGTAAQSLGNSPNSCSTCTPSSPHLTSALPQNDITIDNTEEARDVCVSGAPGEGVRSDEVEMVVREVIREKVAEAVRLAHTQKREEETFPEINHSEEMTHSGCSENGCGYSSDSAQATSLIPTPSPSPPPSPPPSHPPEDTSSQLSRPLIATPITSPPFSRKTDSTSAQSISTPQSEEENMSGIAPRDMPLEEEEDPSASPSLPHLTFSTPPPSSPHQTPPTPSPPSLTKEEPTPVAASSAPPPLPLPLPLPQQLSLSESSTSTSPSTSTEAHPHPHSLTTVTNLTTDQEISMGECMVVGPPLPCAATSLSEGEVALSPGDARWYATYVTKMGKWGPQASSRDDSKPNKSKLSPVVAAFLDLKNSPDSLDGVSDYSDSLQSDSHTASKGEAKLQKERCGGGDPFDRFLANLQASSPETSSTPTPPTSEDNTLSDMPSIAGDNSLSHGEVKERDRELTTVWPQNTRKQHSRGSVRASVPYHKRFPLVEGKSASPGEVRSNTQLALSGRALKTRADLSVSFAQSEGEVHPTIRQRTGKREKKAEQPPPLLSSTASPGELRINLSTANKTRDGIDVIRISNSSPNSRSSRKDASSLRQKTAPPHPVPNLSPLSSFTQPPATGNRVRVRAEMGSARLVTVAASPATLNNEEQATEDNKEHEISKAATSAKSPQLTVLVPLPDLSHDGTKLPGLKSPLHTSSSSSEILPNSSLAEHFTATQPPKTGQPSEQNSPEKHGTCSPSLGLKLHSFWDTESPRIPDLPTAGRVVQESKTLTPPSLPGVLQTEQGKEDRTSLPSNVTDTHATNASDMIITRPNSDDVIPAAGDRGGSTRIQLNISVPFTTAMKDDESAITSPVPSPTYSSDFDFSSISQPTFD